MATRKADAPNPAELRQNQLVLTLNRERDEIVRLFEDWIARGRATSTGLTFGRSIHLPEASNVSIAPYKATSIQFIEQIAEEYRNAGWRIAIQWGESRTATLPCQITISE
jgi:hypothetical protein